jgi:hypothetical protein
MPHSIAVECSTGHAIAASRNGVFEVILKADGL